jgi:GrpB-like predicted nucleotidyltransferase (UPF0157 family)
MIGLRRHTVRLVDHDPNWSALFASERETLQRTFGDLVVDIQHVGSTAVPDLPAKPILDIAMAIRTLDPIPSIVERLTEIGYIYRGDGGDDGGHLFVRESEPDVRAVHVHVVEKAGYQWKDYLAFRNTLCENPDVRKRYATVKLDLAKRFPDDRKSYTASKDEFIRSILSGDEVQQGVER